MIETNNSAGNNSLQQCKVLYHYTKKLASALVYKRTPS